jgi:Na+/H+ antiporter NhaC
MTKGNDMNISKEELAEVRELKHKVGGLMEGLNGSMLMCVLTSVIGDAGAQWRDTQTKQSFIAETVEAISMWYDWYVKQQEKSDE